MRPLCAAMLCLLVWPAGASAAGEVTVAQLASDGTGYQVSFFADLAGRPGHRTAGVGLQSDAVIDQGAGAALIDAPAVASLPLAGARPVTVSAVRNCVRTGMVSLFGTTARPVGRLQAAYSDGRRHDVVLRAPPRGWRSNARVFAVLLETRARSVRLTPFDRDGRRLTVLRRDLGPRCTGGAALPRIRATMTPSAIEPGTAVVLRLTLPSRSRSVEGRWRVTAEVPGFVAGHDPFASPDPQDPFGSPLTPAGPPTLDGPGTTSGGGPGTDVLGASCQRGYGEPTNPDATVIVPGGSTTTLRWAFFVTKAQRWAATDYRVTFRVRNDSGADARFRPAVPRVTGPFGTRFGLRVRRAGRSFVVSGETDPPLRRGRVSLMSAAAKREVASFTPNPNFPADFEPAKAFATFRTDRLGRFTHRWRVPAGRLLDLWAGTFTEGGRLGDSSCHLRVDARSV